jgi:tetratricopeptide (TPR) repeat protein
LCGGADVAAAGLTQKTQHQRMQKTTVKPIVYSQDGVRKEMSEDRALEILEGVANHDVQHALGLYLKLCNANPHAQRLLWKFYDTLLDMFMFDALLEATSARLQRLPHCGVSFSWKINALQHMFRNEEAIAYLDEVDRNNPNDPEVKNTLGTFHKDVGHFERAKACFDRAIELNPHYAPPHWHRSELSTDPATDLAMVESVIAAAKVPEAQSHSLHFAAYRYREMLGDTDVAFEHLSIANAIKRRTFDYDARLETTIDSNVKQLFTAEMMASLTPAPVNDLRPVFIMGMPRSGTTLVEHIIASHSEVAGGDEYTALSNAIMRAQKQSKFSGPIDQWLGSRGAGDWARIGEYYEHNMRFVRGGKRVFTDKNLFNHRAIGIIKASLPNARIIVVDRNPMDVGFGCFRQLFGGDGAKFSYRFDELAAQLASYDSLIDHWESVTDGLILRVKYEELIADPKRLIEDMLRFCELSVEDNCFDFHKTERTVKTLSSAQVRQPIFRQGVGRWKPYESQLKPLMVEFEKLGIVY